MPEKINRGSDAQLNSEKSLSGRDGSVGAQGETGLTPEIVERIEDLSLDPFTKVNLLTVIAGLKPASFIGFESTINFSEIKEIESFVRDSGLKFEIMDRKKKINSTAALFSRFYSPFSIFWLQPMISQLQ